MIEKKIKIGILGLGYVGLPLAIEFGKKFNTIGFDINKSRINELKSGIDSTLEVEGIEVKKTIKDYFLKLTSEEEDLSSCNFLIVTVPTPINSEKKPDLKPLESATITVSKNLNKNDIVVYESTVFPGCTEEFCVPILENNSGLKFNKDFFVGYSPERINPGDKEHTLTKILKLVSGSNEKTLNIVDEVYSSIIHAGTYRTKSIKVAEAAKVIENAQRDINIAFVNELAQIFSRMNIDTHDVLNAAGTKWNFLNFSPGLVGGHCIGVDPYYLSHKSIELGYNPEIILSGRKVNDNMGFFIATEVSKLVNNSGNKIQNSKVLVLGATFKENCPDFRNTKVVDLILSLKLLGANIEIFDPWINIEAFDKVYSIEIINELDNNQKYDVIILAVPHTEFNKINLNKLKVSKSSVVYDVKGFLNKKEITKRL